MSRPVRRTSWSALGRSRGPPSSPRAAQRWPAVPAPHRCRYRRPETAEPVASRCRPARNRLVPVGRILRRPARTAHRHATSACSVRTRSRRRVVHRSAAHRFRSPLGGRDWRQFHRQVQADRRPDLRRRDTVVGDQCRKPAGIPLTDRTTLQVAVASIELAEQQGRLSLTSPMSKASRSTASAERWIRIPIAAASPNVNPCPDPGSPKPRCVRSRPGTSSNSNVTMSEVADLTVVSSSPVGPGPADGPRRQVRSAGCRRPDHRWNEPARQNQAAGR